MNNPSELEKPAGAPTPPADEPAIHTIPEKFYGAALKKVVKEVPVQPPTPPVAPPPPPKAPLAATPGVPPKPKGSKKMIVIGAVAVGVLAIGASVYFLLAPKKSAQVVANTPSQPVCGDRKCDAGETSLNCSADCGPPPVVCGDKKCDAPESKDSCPSDCTPPVVCGDTTCDATETVDACPVDCKPPEPKPSKDTDSDGLSDQEETEVFGSNPNDPNSDKDSFVDLNEALNLFDPAKPTPAPLKDNTHIAVYSNTAQSYTIFRPTAWITKDDDPEKKQVFFNAPSGESVQVLAQEKQPTQSLMDWYLVQSPGVTSSQIEPLTFKTRQGYDAMLSPDQMTAYVDFGDRAMVVSYNLGKQLEIQYRSTFKMMVHSLKKM